VTDADIGLYTVPLFHVNSWGSPHTLTVAGGRHVMIRKFDPLSVLELVQRERINRLQMVPAMLIALINHPDFARYDLSSVKEVITGGAPSNVALVRQVEAKIPSCICHGGYGLTETSPVITCAKLKSDSPETPEETQSRRKASAGYEFGGCEVRVVSPSGRDVKPDGIEIGEVAVRSDVVMKGYWKQNEATARAIRDDWFYTGDLATVDEEGYVLIVDRAKDMILTGGENVASAEIERVLYGHPAVLECAVIAVPDPKWGEVPKALVVCKTGNTVTEAELLEHCRKHLAGFKVPKSVEFLGELPKGGTGKILKKVLREKYWAGHDKRVS